MKEFFDELPTAHMIGFAFAIAVITTYIVVLVCMAIAKEEPFDESEDQLGI